MKLSWSDDYDAISRAWGDTIEGLVRIDHAMSNGSSCTLYVDGKPLPEGDECFDSNNDLVFLYLARVSLVTRLHDLVKEYRDIGVEVDWFTGLPRDVVLDVFGQDALSNWERNHERLREAPPMPSGTNCTSLSSPGTGEDVTSVRSTAAR